MSWKDRDHFDDGSDGGSDDPSRRLGRPGGDWQGIRPSLDNPMTWSVPFGRVIGIGVRIHIVFIVFAVVRLAQGFSSGHLGQSRSLDAALVAMEIVALFVIVLLHEFGHCLACRQRGGEADEILMWPLGGLAYCRPPSHWTAHLWTAAGGPLVNVVILCLLAPLLLALTGVWWGVAIPNPFGYHPVDALDREPWWLLMLIALNRWNLLLLLFNLLPIFPLDGGRIGQALLWPKLGYVRSMRAAVHIGYFGAIALGIAGAVMNAWMLIAIAVFGGVTCYMTVKQLEWTESIVGGSDDLYAQSLAADPPEEPKRPSRAERREAARVETRERAREAESSDVDRILAKIGEHGMDSLSGDERRLLERATNRQRGEEDGGRS